MTKDEREALIDRIRKCLALAKSANEHEAAAAMAKAQKLMRDHNLGLGDVEFDEATARGNGCSAKPPLWETSLIIAVKLAFPCHAFLDDGCWKFVGRAPSAELGAYAFTVLHRQLKAARAEHIRTRLRRVRPGRKTARADEYCEGWMVAILSKLRKLAVAREPDQKLAEHVRDRYHLVPLEDNRRKVSGSAGNDYWHGYNAGRAADLHRPMTGRDGPVLIS